MEREAVSIVFIKMAISVTQVKVWNPSHIYQKKKNKPNVLSESGVVIKSTCPILPLKTVTVSVVITPKIIAKRTYSQFKCLWECI